MITRFSPLTWKIISDPRLNPKDAAGSRLLLECMALQQMILSKTGQEYVNYLRAIELKNLGMQPEGIENYINMMGTTDAKTLRQYIEGILLRR